MMEKILKISLSESKYQQKNINRFIQIPNEIIQDSDTTSHVFISVEDLIGK